MAEQNAENVLWIDLDLVDLPADVRVHTDEDIDAMVQDLEEQGQIENITVVRKGERYEVVAGARRTLAAKKKGNHQIKAEVRTSLSEYERLNIMFSENEDRIEANPLYQALLLKRMLVASGLNQGEFAKRKGKTGGWLSQRLILLEFPEPVVQIFTAVKITEWALRSLKSLSDDAKMMVATEVRDGHLAPLDVPKRVKELLKATSLPQSSGSGSSYKWAGSRIQIRAELSVEAGISDALSVLRTELEAWIETHPRPKQAT